MAWLIHLAAFATGFAAGAWRARAPQRHLVSAASQLPLLILILMALVLLYSWATAPSDRGMIDLALIVVASLGTLLALETLFGGLLGACYQRARRARP